MTKTRGECLHSKGVVQYQSLKPTLFGIAPKQFDVLAIMAIILIYDVHFEFASVYFVIRTFRPSWLTCWAQSS